MTIKRIEHYTSQDIFESFEELHEYALNCFKHAQDTGKQQKDEAKIAWKMIMELLGKDIWKHYNPFLEGEEKEETI